MKILGLSADYHDAAAALVVDGAIVAAAEEERFSRRKHDASLPVDAIRSCLAIADLRASEVDVVVFHEKPLLVASRVLAARQRRGPRALGSFAREMPTLLSTNLMVAHRIERAFAEMGADPPTIAYAEHHLSHAAAAFYPSPFASAATLTVDGIGEWSTATIGRGLRGELDLLEEQRYPHSLGLLYSLVTSWCGFAPNDGEYKLMGLAPYGAPGSRPALDRIATVHDDGAVEVDARAVRWWGGDLRRRRALVDVLGCAPREPDEPLGQAHADLARAMQELAEEAVVAMARHARQRTGERALCLAGGVALNGVAAGRVRREAGFDDVWVQPAAGDAGSALGAALWYWYGALGNERPVPSGDAMRGAALGPSFSSAEIGTWLAAVGRQARRIPDLDARCAEVASHLERGAIVGWFEGAMEFGPRALGHRSILADPRGPTTQRDLNLRVKGRESFRPFAPAVLEEHAASWFDLDGPSPHMSFVCPVRDDRLVPVEHEPSDLTARSQVPRSTIPACTHVDGTARVQTVDAERSPAFHRLLGAFHEATGCPVLLNTSFNRAGDPIVCTPDEALDAAIAAGLDLLVLEDHLVELPGAART